jgi:CubicO group peptidase (beta-lactamase class C family)
MTCLVLSLSVLLAMPASSTPAAAPDAWSVARAFDAYAWPLLQRGDLSGQLLVHRNGLLLLERSFGKASLELSAAVTPQTRFNIASVTKPMTTIMAMQLIDEKKLGFRDSVSRWLPGFPKGDSITIEDLLRHRSGIPHEVIPDSEMIRPFSAAELVERAKKLPLDFSPGSQSRYSSGGFEVLARILERADQRPYDRMLVARICEPLGMSRTSHANSRDIVPERATGYVPGPYGIENAPLQDFSALVGAGSVWSTARDLHRFVDAVVQGKLGRNVQLSFVRNGKLDFNGRTGGFKAWAVYDSASGVEAIFVGNVATGAPDALKNDIMKIAIGDSASPPSLPALRKEPAGLAELRRWEGVYQIANGPRLDLRVRDGALYSNDWVMLPTADGGLFSPRDYGRVSAVRDAKGAITRLDWIQGSQTYPAPRVAD